MKKRLYGDPEKIVKYLDYTETPEVDNSRYVPDLVPGILQPLEVNEIMEEDPAFDKLLSTMDIEAIVSAAEESTKNVEQQVHKNLNHFPDPVSTDTLSEFSHRKFALSTKKKAMWAGRIFEQWKCI